MWTASFHGLGPGLNKKEKEKWEKTFLSLCFLAVQAKWPTASASCHHAFPIMTDHTLVLWIKITPGSLKLLWLVFYPRNRKKYLRCKMDTKSGVVLGKPDHVVLRLLGLVCDCVEKSLELWARKALAFWKQAGWATPVEYWENRTLRETQTAEPPAQELSWLTGTLSGLALLVQYLAKNLV